jgi:hypothetical protein
MIFLGFLDREFLVGGLLVQGFRGFQGIDWDWSIAGWERFQVTYFIICTGPRDSEHLGKCQINCDFVR